MEKLTLDTYCRTTPDRRQSKMLLIIDECGSKIARNSVFFGLEMAIENSVSNDFSSTFVDSINIFDCRLSSVRTVRADSLHTTDFPYPWRLFLSPVFLAAKLSF